MLICLGLSDCQGKPVDFPTLAITTAPTLSGTEASLEKLGQLEDQKYYQGALTLIAVLQSDSPDYAAEHAGELSDRKAGLYIAWGSALRDSGLYLQALEKYALAKDPTTANDLRTQIDTEIQNANDLLANDSGEDGLSLLEQAMAGACYQEIIPTPPSSNFLK
jgi:hypothetical protein